MAWGYKVQISLYVEGDAVAEAEDAGYVATTVGSEVIETFKDEGKKVSFLGAAIFVVDTKPNDMGPA